MAQDFESYLVEQNQRAAINARIDALGATPEERQKDQEAVVRRDAVQRSYALAEQAETLCEQYEDLLARLKEVRDDARAGRVSASEAVEALREADRHRQELLQQRSALQEGVRSNDECLADPAARRAALVGKFPSLAQ